jgi:hypothetical protein
VEFTSFAGGLYLPDERTAALPVDALLQARNVEFTVGGAVVGRRGVLKYNSSALPGAVRGLWRHYPRGTTGFGTGKLFAVAQDGTSHEFYTGNDGTGAFTEIAATSLTSSIKIPAFVNWPSKNKTFWAYGDDTNGLRSFDNSAIATVSTTGLDNDKLGPYLALHKSRLWATYFGETNYSIYASNMNDETTWTAADHLNVSDDQGGTVTGIIGYLDYLLIFKSTTTFRFQGDIGAGGQLVRYSDRGCIAPLTIQRTPYGIVFLDRDGLYMTDGQNALGAEISKPIRTLFVDRDGQTTYPNAIGRWFPRKEQYWLKLDPSAADGYVLHRVQIFAENILTGEKSQVVWIWSYMSNMPMTGAACVFDSESDSGDIVMGDDNGFVRYGDIGSQDDGVSFTSRLQTLVRLMDAEHRTSRVTAVKTFHRAAAALTGAIRYDEHTSDDITFTIGDATSTTYKDSQTKIYEFSKMGRFASVILESSGSYNFEVQKIQLDTRKLSARVHRARNA